jgi:hypothetical protein
MAERLRFAAFFEREREAAVFFGGRFYGLKRTKPALLISR